MATKYGKMAKKVMATKKVTKKAKKSK